MSDNASELEQKTVQLEDRVKKLQEQILAQDESKKANLITGKGVPNMTGSRSNSLENQALGLFGCGHVKQLLEVNTCKPEFKHVPVEVKEFVLNLKKNVDISRYMSQLFYGEKQDAEGKEDVTASKCKTILENSFAKNIDLAGQIKAFSSGSADNGGDWIPTLMSATYIEEYELMREVQGLLKTIPMGSNPFEMPFKKNGTKARKIGEGAPMTAANFQTDKLQFNAIKSGEYFELPEELNEDTAPSILEIARGEVVKAQIRAIEAALVNGCTGVHMDSDFAAEGADIAEKYWNGLRKLALANVANGSVVDFGAGISTTKLDAMRKAMAKFGVNVKELAWIVSPNGWNQMLGLTEVSTIDKFGPMATILNGALASFRGIPIIISEHMRDDLNASGVYDGVTSDNTGVLLVNKTRFMIGQRRPIRVRVQMDSNLAYDRWLMSSYQRIAFKGFDQDAKEKSVIYGINATI